MGGGTKYDQSSGAERVGNAEFARSQEDSRARSGVKNDRPHALSLTGQQAGHESPQKRRTERATGSSTPLILKQEGLEQPRGKEVQSRTSRWNPKMMGWMESNGGQVCTG
jgi:hypothetical protein